MLIISIDLESIGVGMEGAPFHDHSVISSQEDIIPIVLVTLLN